MPAILIAEDDLAILNVLHDAFTQYGFSTVLAKNGEEALTLFCLHTLDLIITDLMMPGMEGLETIIRIRSVNATIPIIAMTGGAIGPEADLLTLAMKAGATESLKKPFIVTDLRDSIHRHYFPDHPIPLRS